jgi:hypothetical protein
MTGEMSIPPKLGTHLLIGLRTGSVMRYIKSYIWETTLFCVLMILKLVSQLIATTIIRHHMYKPIIWSIRKRKDNIELDHSLVFVIGIPAN